MKCSLTVGASGNFWLLPVPLVRTHANSQKTQPKKHYKIVMGWMHTFLMPLAARESVTFWWSFSCCAAAARILAGLELGDLCRGRGKSRLRVRHVGGRGALSQETWENESCNFLTSFIYRNFLISLSGLFVVSVVISSTVHKEHWHSVTGVFMVQMLT